MCVWACFNDGKRVDYVPHINSVKRAFKRRNISSDREIELNLHQNRTNDYDLRVSGLVSTLENASTTFCTYNLVKKAFERQNISNGREINHNFGQNRRMIAICLCLGLFRSWKTRALRSARKFSEKSV